MAPGAPEGRRMKGVPLAAKMSLIISTIVAVFMLIFGFVLVRSVEDTVRFEVQYAAADAARTAAQADLDAWTPNYGTVDQGLTQSEIQARVDEMTPFTFRAYETDATRKAQVSWNRGRFARFLGSGTRVVAVELFRWTDGQRSSLAGASYTDAGGRAREASFSPAQGASMVTLGEGGVQEGFLSVGSDRWHVIRGSYPVMNQHGVQTGEVAVHLEAAAIQGAISRFAWKVAYAGCAFVLAGAVIAFVLGRRMTRPMRMLQDDIRAVAAGDLEHHTRPHSSDEVGQLARTFDQMTRSLAEAQSSQRAAAVSRRELEVAAEVTGSLFPRSLPDIQGWSFAGLHDSSGTPAGSTYDILNMPGRKRGLLLAEASGTGVPAALVTAMTRSTLRVIAEHESDPGAVLRDVNARISEDLPQGLYVTALLAVIDLDTGEMAIANAGHPPLLHQHAGIDGIETVLSEGIAMGFDDGPVFDQTLKVAQTVLEPGDKAILYSSGISSLSGGEGQVLGEERFAALVRREAGKDVQLMMKRMDATLRKFRGRPELGPEVTMLSIGREA